MEGRGGDTEEKCEFVEHICLEVTGEVIDLSVMAVLANNSDGCSVPAKIVENLEMDDDYNKYAPSADYNSTGGRNIFRNKKLTKKRHESKTRRTDQGSTNVCCSDEGKKIEKK